MKTVGDFSKTDFSDFVSKVADELASYRNLPQLARKVREEMLKQESKQKEADDRRRERENKFGTPKWISLEGELVVKDELYFSAGLFVFDKNVIKPGAELVYCGRDEADNEEGSERERVNVSFEAWPEALDQKEKSCYLNFCSVATESIPHGTVVLPVIHDQSVINREDVLQRLSRATFPCAAYFF